MNYLCDNHLKELAEAPEKAEALYSHWLDSAQTAAAEHQWKKAIQICGCAFDTAQMMLNKHVDGKAIQSLDKLIASGSLLARLYAEFGNAQYAATISASLCDYLEKCQKQQRVNSCGFALFDNHLMNLSSLCNELKLTH